MGGGPTPKVGCAKLLLPPANEVCEGYVFTGVSTHWGAGCLVQGGLLPGGSLVQGICCQGSAWSGMPDRGVLRPPVMATTVGGMHPTGMHSCYRPQQSCEGYYRPLRSCEGYVFTGVCLSTGGESRLLLRTVRILLECILVLDIFSRKLHGISTLQRKKAPAAG